MKNRLVTTSDRTQFGLIAWLEQTRVVLPLKGVECRFGVCGELLRVEIDQIFHQNTLQPLDCLYTFPLPAGAAVYRCEMHVNDRVIRARVEELERARKIAREKKQAGHRTALVEMERENLFTFSLGNLQPGDLIVVRFAYFQTLARLQDWTSFQVPFCPGIRYIPGQPLLRAPRGKGVADDTDQVPDASRISPPRIDQLHPDAAYLSIRGTVENPAGLIRDLSSATHPVWIHDREKSFEVRIADGDAASDRDFVLRWTEAVATELSPVGWRVAEDKKQFALVRLHGPTDAAVSDEVDVYFLLDRSGSMAGVKWNKTAQAFREFVKGLGPKNRVWLTLFESGYRDFAEKPLPAADVLKDSTVQRLELLGTGGGTELLPALTHVVSKVAEHSHGRTAVLVLITDGQVGNEREILAALRQQPSLRVHTFGIDTAVNDAFLKQMAAQQHGTCCLVTPRDDIVGTVARLGQRLQRPVLTNLRVEGDWELAAEKIPDLHAGDIVSVILRGPVLAQEIRITGNLPNGTPQRYCFTFEARPEPALRLLWAKRRIDDCLAKGDAQAAIRLAKEHNLICEGTAFIAWDDAEKVAVSLREIYQPALEPKVMMDACFAVASMNSSLPPQLAAGKVSVSAPGAEPLASDEMELQDVLGEIRRDPVLFAPLTEQLFTVLCEWATSNVEERRLRLQAVNDLLARLRAAVLEESARSQVVQEWLERHLKPEERFYRRALEALHRREVGRNSSL
jgi:Ca-activated chloride channel family protein